ncbi:hypothetical protein PGT21_024270 [Puccinia graminis f. sp. tritici]|nr:hypothetical protein PGT21_024270 [Puccinia graminis f. sp. tritici]
MTALRAPNHPSILTGLFEPTANSIPEAQRGNQYGVLNTPSFFQCAGYMNQQLTDFEVILVTNTALNNVLEAGACYLISGRLISLNDGSTPTLTYNHDTVVRIAGPGTSGPELTNRTSAVGLGHVVERAEVLAGEADGGPRLEVVVAHNNWDAIARTHRRFLVKYIIPSTKNFIKTHSLYQIGRKLQLLGHLVDFELERHMAVFVVHSVSLTSGHQVGWSVPGTSSSATASPRTGRKFVKFGGPSHETPAQDVSPSPAEGSTPSQSRHTTNKGKNKALTDSDDNGSSSEEVMAREPDVTVTSNSDITSKRGRPRKNILHKAAKHMKRT